jgi:hypothetical protein
MLTVQLQSVGSELSCQADGSFCMPVGRSCWISHYVASIDLSTQRLCRPQNHQSALPLHQSMKYCPYYVVFTHTMPCPCHAIPLRVLASCCQLQAVVDVLLATRAMSVLWAYKDFDPSSVATTTGHTGRTIIRIRPQHKHCLSSL